MVYNVIKIILLLLVLLPLPGCKRPGFRMGTLAVETIGNSFPDPNNLGIHGSWSEKNGILYTCNAGHIDLAHVRKTVDWTAYLTEKSYKNLMKNQKSFSFKLEEPSIGYVTIDYPDYWYALEKNKKQKIAHDISIKLSCYLAYTIASWHEILTWFGYKATGFYSEFPSAFSWEDSFSNLLGVYVAATALNDNGHPFNEAVTIALDENLERLCVQPSDIARLACEKMNGQWYSKKIFSVDIKKRNFDIGIDNGFVEPTIVSSLLPCPCDKEQMYMAPNLGFQEEYKFNIKFEIEPRVWEKNKLLAIAYPDSKIKNKRIEPSRHFSAIMQHIENDTRSK